MGIAYVNELARWLGRSCADRFGHDWGADYQSARDLLAFLWQFGERGKSLCGGERGRAFHGTQDFCFLLGMFWKRTGSGQRLTSISFLGSADGQRACPGKTPMAFKYWRPARFSRIDNVNQIRSPPFIVFPSLFFWGIFRSEFARFVVKNKKLRADDGELSRSAFKRQHSIDQLQN